MLSGLEENAIRQFHWRVAVVEDHLLQRRGVVTLLGAQTGVRVVWSGETLPMFLGWCRRIPASQQPHLLVLDLHADRGPSADPGAVAVLIRGGMRVMLLSALGSPDSVRAMIQSGVTGAVSKRDPEQDIVGAMWTVLARGRWWTPELATVLTSAIARPELSPQEKRALVLYAAGATLDSVAEALGVRRDTAKKYISRVKVKYAAIGRPLRTKVEMNTAARQDGFMSDVGSSLA